MSNAYYRTFETVAELAAHDADVIERAATELGVYVGDEEGDYWTGYRDGQRRQIHVLKNLAAEAREET